MYRMMGHVRPSGVFKQTCQIYCLCCMTSSLVMVVVHHHHCYKTDINKMEPNAEPQMIRVESVWKQLASCLFAFSVLRNGSVLFNTDSPSAFIDSVNGGRVLSMVWIV
jgi:hypothetical protein